MKRSSSYLELEHENGNGTTVAGGTGAALGEKKYVISTFYGSGSPPRPRVS